MAYTNTSNQHTFEELILNHLDRISVTSLGLASIQNPPITALGYKRLLEVLETFLAPIQDNDYKEQVKKIKDKIEKNQDWKYGPPKDEPFYALCNEWLSLIITQAYIKEVLMIKKPHESFDEYKRGIDDENSSQDD